MAHIMTKLPVTSRSQVQLRINNNSQSQGLIGRREANGRREGISLCLMLLICMQCCSHHWSLPLSQADITLGAAPWSHARPEKEALTVTCTKAKNFTEDRFASVTFSSSVKGLGVNNKNMMKKNHVKDDYFTSPFNFERK